MIFQGTRRGAKNAHKTCPRTIVNQRGQMPVKLAPTGSELLPAFVTSTASIMPKLANTMPARAVGLQCWSRIAPSTNARLACIRPFLVSTIPSVSVHSIDFWSRSGFNRLRRKHLLGNSRRSEEAVVDIRMSILANYSNILSIIAKCLYCRVSAWRLLLISHLDPSSELATQAVWCFPSIGKEQRRPTPPLKQTVRVDGFIQKIARWEGAARQHGLSRS
jgi:hypothetical protein